MSASTPWGTFRVRHTAGVFPTPQNGWMTSKTVGVSIFKALLHATALLWEIVVQAFLAQDHIHAQGQTLNASAVAGMNKLASGLELRSLSCGDRRDPLITLGSVL